MKQPKAKTKNEILQKQQEAKEARRREENAKKAREAVGELFPGEKWESVEGEERIYKSTYRAIGKTNSNFDGELRDAQILRDLGSTVYLVPEQRNTPGKKYDAIVNGDKMEFKNVVGNSNTLITHFLKSRSQAPNVFINFEKSNLTCGEIMTALYWARNSQTHTDKKGNIIKGYGDSNAFRGGKIILKIKGHKNLIYLNVDDLKKPEQ